MTDKDLLQEALAAFESGSPNDRADVMKAIRARLAQPEHGDGYRWREGDVPPSITYTTPPQREWQGLTEEELFAAENSVPDEVIADRDWCVYFARAIEAKLKERNHERL